MFKAIKTHKWIIYYGSGLALLLLLLRGLELFILYRPQSQDIFTGIIALTFTGLGIWLALKLSKPKVETIIVEKPVYVYTQPYFTPNEAEIEKLCISKRELEVLQLMADGLSNKEIAEQLFVSLNTVKTHSSKLFEKMDVKRRTQAVEKAKKNGIIA
ncbi:response regulator transcription factor [Flavobacterium sp. DG1-102-2]|uniref:response regulator transcription factor n=1 Tax=Flavobacterium sp. DG1-102-2 TaxID=3081663 RepID=UPI002949A246|nr:response regulator transcription factor [Flavobacterium sp. DG1-102-2]MDV6168724.1 response regulator transcription factor [Flavobacterium sp. DG1-102-2]